MAPPPTSGLPGKVTLPGRTRSLPSLTAVSAGPPRLAGLSRDGGAPANPRVAVAHGLSPPTVRLSHSSPDHKGRRGSHPCTRWHRPHGQPLSKDEMPPEVATAWAPCSWVYGGPPQPPALEEANSALARPTASVWKGRVESGHRERPPQAFRRSKVRSVGVIRELGRSSKRHAYGDPKYVKSFVRQEGREGPAGSGLLPPPQEMQACASSPRTLSA